MNLLTLQGNSVGRHFGNVLGQIDMGGAGLAILGIFESQADNFAYRVGQNDLFGTLGNRGIHSGQIQVLMAGQLHLVGAHLAGNGHQRRAIQIGIGHAGDQIGGTGTQCGKTDAGPAGETAVDICHKSGALLMAHRNKTNMAVADGEHQVQCLFAGDAKHNIDTFGFQTVHQDLGGCFLLLLHLLIAPVAFMISKQKRRCCPYPWQRRLCKPYCNGSFGFTQESIFTKSFPFGTLKLHRTVDRAKPGQQPAPSDSVGAGERRTRGPGSAANRCSRSSGKAGFRGQPPHWKSPQCAIRLPQWGQ